MEDQHGHRQRLRARFEQAGLDGFADHEALELLLCYAIPRKDVKPIAKELLKRFGGLTGVLNAAGEDLLEVPGIGESAGVLLRLMRPLFQRYQRGLLTPGQPLLEGDRLFDYCAALLSAERYERLYVLALDSRGRLLLSHLVSEGDEGETAVYPRLIVAALLRARASQAVLCHNHPAGDPAPSLADRQMTEALRSMLAPLHIRLYDHVVVGAEGLYSFRREGLIELEKTPWQKEEEDAAGAAR